MINEQKCIKRKSNANVIPRQFKSEFFAECKKKNTENWREKEIKQITKSYNVVIINMEQVLLKCKISQKSTEGFTLRFFQVSRSMIERIFSYKSNA